jgi:ABC transporter fused permease/ATP-binding protein
MASIDRDEKQKSKRVGVLRRLLPLLRPHRGRFALATLLLLVGSGLNLVFPQAARHAIDAGMKQANTDELDRLAAAVVGVFVLSALLTWARHYFMSWLGERVVADLRVLVYQRLLQQPLSFFQERSSGELTGRLASDVGTIQSMVGSELSIAMRELVTLVGGLVMLVIQSWQMTASMMLVIPPVLIVGFVFSKRIRSMSKAAQDQLAQTSAQAQESVAAIFTVQAFRREAHETMRYQNVVDGFFGQALKLATWRGLFIATMSLLGWLATAAMLWLGGRQIIAGTLSAGDLTAFLLYTTMVAVSLGGLANLWGSLQSAAGATERLFDILDRVPEVRDDDNPETMDTTDHSTNHTGSFAFRGVGFAYPSRAESPVLKNFSLEVKAGETVAVVGRSGAGKSTLAALLYRFFDVQQGAVMVDGHDVRKVRLKELRGRFAIVSQEPTLFSGTIHDNIAFARPQATRDEVERAAKLAHAHDFTIQFADGYNTVVGERGVKLSGGQRQRLAIARALLADPRILILDEATSALDSESEALVQDALATLMKGRTTLVIAHRLSTVKDADRIVVLDNGAIAEMGTHQELVMRKGMYASLVEHQMVGIAA